MQRIQFFKTVNEKPMESNCEESKVRKQNNDTDDILQMNIHSRYVNF
jgi:hypothetical protein